MKSVQFLKPFWGVFLSHEYINSFEEKICKIDVTDVKTFQPLSQIFVGHSTATILSSLDKEEAKTYRRAVLNAYKETAVYLKQKLPINNDMLATLSAIDPALCGHSKAAWGLNQLFDKFVSQTSVLSKDSFSLAASQLQTDQEFTSNIEESQLDKRWKKVLNNPKYSVLTPVVKCFFYLFSLALEWKVHFLL